MLTLVSTRELIAMGVHCRIDIVSTDAPALLESCVDLLNSLEQLWSRFIPTSDISRLNLAEGAPTYIDPHTATLIAAMQQACDFTKGSFNPTQLPAQVNAGDAQSLATPGSTLLSPNSRSFTTLHDVVMEHGPRVKLPKGMTLDAGGIGKGLAADLIVEHARSRGASAVTVNLGGDIRVAQDPNATRDTPIDIHSPAPHASVVSTISLRQGAVATSARNARWRNGQGIQNHIMGVDNDIMSASVIASSAMWADVWAKHLILSPHGLHDIQTHGLAGLVMHNGGHIEASTSWKEFEQC
jgi:thiamine biosynthesis lipoprotein